MRLILASNNDNKLIEIKEILKEIKIELVNLNDLNYYEDIKEDGLTFRDNAIIKAKTISKKFSGFVLADDSGLEVEALNNRPGINSKRYSGGGDYENNVKLLEELLGVQNRKARFISVIALFSDGKLINTYKGVMEGSIDDKITGNNNFGYDPVFIPKGLNVSAANISLSEKNKISHRSKALNLFIKDFLKLITAFDK